MIRLGTDNDVDKLEELYNELNDYLENSINYPGWKKGVYPTREDAVSGIKEGTLYIAIINDEIAGTIILNHKSDLAYSEVIWQKELDHSKVYVIHTFAVHPKYFNQSVGKKLIEFSNEHAKKNNVEVLRLDVYEGNMPAIKLYEKCGFKYIDKIDLGLESYGLKWFRVYEKLI